MNRGQIYLIPHSWLLKVMDLTKIAGNIGKLLQSSMGMWKTELTCNGDKLGDIQIKRGIFQGDSLSPLLFVMAMIPLTTLLRRESCRQLPPNSMSTTYVETAYWDIRRENL